MLIQDLSKSFSLALTATLLLLAPCVAQEIESSPARPFLWRIEPKVEGGAASWLFGTIHFPDERVLQIAPSVRQAFAASDAFYGELAMEPEVMLAAQSQVMLPKGDKLSDLLPPEVVEKLRAFLAERKLPLEAFEPMKPWVVMTQLATLDRMAELAGNPAMDSRLYDDAKAAGKDRGGLETMAEQTGVFERFDADEQALLLSMTIDQIEAFEAKGEDVIENTILAYLSGSTEQLLALFDMGDDQHPELSDRMLEGLLWHRNRVMAERIQAKIQASPETEFFFAVGAAHYATELGVQVLLRDAGFEIQRIGAGGEAVAEMNVADLRLAMRRLEGELSELEAALVELEAEPDEAIGDEVEAIRARFERIKDVMVRRIEELRQAEATPVPLKKAG